MTALGGAMIRSSRTDSLAAVLNDDGPPPATAAAALEASTSSVNPHMSTSPPGESAFSRPVSTRTTSSKNSGFVVTSRPKTYHPPASSTPSTTPSTPSLHSSTMSAFSSARSSPRVPLKTLEPAFRSDAEASARSHQGGWGDVGSALVSQGSHGHRPPHLSLNQHQHANSSPHFPREAMYAPVASTAASTPGVHHGSLQPFASTSGTPYPTSPPRAPSVEPKTTLHLSSSVDAKGRRTVNQYVRLRTIGQGSHGKVWLCAEPVIRSRRSYTGDSEDTSTRGSFDGHASGSATSRAEVDEAAVEAAAAARRRSRSKARRSASSQLARALSESTTRRAGGYTTDGLEDERAWAEELQFDEIEFAAIKSVAREGRGMRSLRKSKGRSSGQEPEVVSGGIGSDDKVKREVAIMKRLDHKNVVRLKEVIDDAKSKKVFMVLEYMAGGQVVWQDEDKQPMMTVDETRRTFRQVVLGLEYLHYQGIIHRDIKPANLLWSADKKTVKISDFGVSHVSDALLRAAGKPDGHGPEEDKALRKTAGSPAFFAPELCHSTEYSRTPTEGVQQESYLGSEDVPSMSGNLVKRRSYNSANSIQHDDGEDSTDEGGRKLTSKVISPPLPKPTGNEPRQRPSVGKAIDVWALGVTLYCLLFGDTPFMAHTEYELYNVIVKQGVRVPEVMGADHVWSGLGKGWEGCGDGVEGREAVDLLSKLLEKDPAKRIELSEVKQHPWVLRDLDSPGSWLSETDPSHEEAVIITEEDVKQATQERGTLENLPKMRNRVRIRNALQAALVRLPDFTRSSKHRSTEASRQVRSRSKSASSASQSNEAPSEGPPSRHPSDGNEHFLGRTSTRRSQRDVSASSRRTVSPSGQRPPPHSGGSPSQSVLGRWGSKKKSDTSNTSSPIMPELSRSVSNSSFGQGRAFQLLPVRKKSDPKRHSVLLEHNTSQSSSSPVPSQRSSSPFVATSDTESAGGKKRLTKMLSRLGGRPTAHRQSSVTTDEDVGSVAGSDVATADDPPPRYASRSLAKTSHMSQEFKIEDEDLCIPPHSGEDTTNYSSEFSSDEYDDDDDDDDDDFPLNSPPDAVADGINGWRRNFTVQVGVQGVDEIQELDEDPDALLSTCTVKTPIHSSFSAAGLSDATPKAAVQYAEFTSRKVPGVSPPPLMRHHSDTPSKVSSSRTSARPSPKSSPEAVRDGSIRSGVTGRGSHSGSSDFNYYFDLQPTTAPVRTGELGGLAPPRQLGKSLGSSGLDSHSSAGHSSDGCADDADDEENELFVAPKRKRALTVASP